MELFDGYQESVNPINEYQEAGDGALECWKVVC